VNPTQLAIQGQWWSMFSTHRWQVEQWWHLNIFLTTSKVWNYDRADNICVCDSQPTKQRIPNKWVLFLGHWKWTLWDSIRALRRVGWIWLRGWYRVRVWDLAWTWRWRWYSWAGLLRLYLWSEVKRVVHSSSNRIQYITI